MIATSVGSEVRRLFETSLRKKRKRRGGGGVWGAISDETTVG